jgi:energy-coupling factor transporter transmembrane protein EcfT
MKKLRKILSKKSIVIIASFLIPAILVVINTKNFELLSVFFFIAITSIPILLIIMLLMLLTNCIINLKRRKWFRFVLNIVFMLLLVFILVVITSNTIFYGPKRTHARDARRVSDIYQIELGLELYHIAHEEYPTNMQVLIDESFLNMGQVPTDPKTEKPYNYAYGINKESSTIQHYHIGTILENEISNMLEDDADYNSSFDTTLVDWQHDENYMGPCIGNNGFDGADDSNCGAIYDKGILPK